MFTFFTFDESSPLTCSPSVSKCCLCHQSLCSTNKTCLITGALGVPTKIYAQVDNDLLRGAICNGHCDLDSALLASLPMVGLWRLMLMVHAALMSWTITASWNMDFGCLGACVATSVSLRRSVPCACARDLDFGAKFLRRSVTWAVQLKNRGRPRCCTTPSSKKEGEPLASLVLMALIRDLRSRLFRWGFCEYR